ncbi:MAG: hypothetical protein E7538_00245 [Ruminococcaceae bacterium]|nr:hypothetical protein [Oscillospiraceae bacterium]
MKKIISLLLAVLMIFSVATTAFATEGEATDSTNTEAVAPDAPAEGEEGDATDSIIPDLGEYDWILDLPFWTVGPAFKFAKIAFKLVSVYLKVAKIFGLVEQDMDDMILDVLLGLIEDAENGGQVQEETTTEPATEAAA